MRYVKPDYFDEFRCAAGNCPDTCCAGWQIMIDDSSLERYGQDRSAFGNRLLNGIDWSDGSFLQDCGRCSMLNEQNLCELVIAKGEDWLCETCSRYPRHVEEYEGLREWSLSLSCPVAAELILSHKSPVQFLTTEDEETDPLEDEFEDFDFLLFTQLEDARNVLLAIVQNRTLSIEKRMGLILTMAEKMQDCINEEHLYEMDEVIQSYVGYTAKANNHDNYEYIESLDGEERYRKLCKGFSYLEQMERLRDEWSEVLQETKRTLYSKGYESYQEISLAFQKEFVRERSMQEQWADFMENLLLFFLYTYFCGAVYDDWVYSKAALSVFCTAFIQEFVMSRWFLADKQIDMQDCIELAYRFAREVEHSDENLNFLEESLNGETA